MALEAELAGRFTLQTACITLRTNVLQWVVVGGALFEALVLEVERELCFGIRVAFATLRRLSCRALGARVITVSDDGQALLLRINQVPI